LQEYSVKGNKTKVSALKKEMKDAFGINASNIKFRQDNRKFIADKKNNSINQSLVSIKYLNQKISSELYKLKDKTYNNFIELLIDIKNTSINSRQLDILVKLNYFSEFGKAKTINKQIEIFNSLYDRSQINKDKLFELGLTLPLIKKFAQKETDKLFKDIDIIGLIHDLCDHVAEENYTLKERIIFENDYLGYIKTILPNIRTTCYFISDIETKYTHPIVTLHCL
jgi:DNA polymerase III alpha subunit